MKATTSGLAALTGYDGPRRWFRCSPFSYSLPAALETFLVAPVGSPQTPPLMPRRAKPP